jgi:FixJ family two-component response regulator
MNRKIGLIEDDATMRSLLVTLFKLEGYQPITFDLSSIEEVMNKIVKEAPSALLIDVHLKTFNGMDLTKRLLATTNIQQPIIVMASGMDLSTECKAVGADHFFLKPYMPQDLIDWLKQRIK